MIQQQQTNQYPRRPDASDLDLELVYVSKFPVWSTFLTNLLPSIIFFLVAMVSFYFMLTLTDETDPKADKRTIGFVVFLFCGIAALVFVYLFHRHNFQVPIFQGPYRDYLIYLQRLHA